MNKQQNSFKNENKLMRIIKNLQTSQKTSNFSKEIQKSPSESQDNKMIFHMLKEYKNKQKSTLSIEKICKKSKLNLLFYQEQKNNPKKEDNQNFNLFSNQSKRENKQMNQALKAKHIFLQLFKSIYIKQTNSKAQNEKKSKRSFFHTIDSRFCFNKNFFKQCKLIKNSKKDQIIFCIMTSSYQFLQSLQMKKKGLDSKKSNTKLDLQEMQYRIQVPAVKMEKQKIKISADECSQLIRIARSKLIQQQSLLKIQGPIYIVTGTYGCYKELSLIFEKCGNPKFVNYIFLGDYTGIYDRGIQCLTALLTYKIKYPFNFFMLRGSYESIGIVNSSHLAKEVKEYFGSLKILNQINELFCCLPFAGIVYDQIFCVHGGISPYLFSLDQINKIYRPINTTQHGLPHQLVFGEPTYEESLSNSPKMVPKFTQKDCQSFMKRTNMKVIIRCNSVIEHGFQFLFNKSVVNLCSISNFRNQLNNSSAVLMIDDAFKVIPRQINSYMLQKNEEGLTFEEIVQLRQEKKSKMKQSQRQDNNDS